MEGVWRALNRFRWGLHPLGWVGEALWLKPSGESHTREGMAAKSRKAFTQRERYGMILGLGVAGSLAWAAHLSGAIDFREDFDAEPPPASVPALSAEAPSEEKGVTLSASGVVQAVNAARPGVKECYLAEFSGARDREQVVIVTFQAEVRGEEGLVFQGEVPVADSVSAEFDQCVKEKLFVVHFDANAPSGRQRVVFPFAFELPHG